MEDRTLVKLVRLAAVTGGVLAVAGSAVTIAVAGAGGLWGDLGSLFAFLSLSFGIFVWFIVDQQPRNMVVWVMAVVVVAGGLWLAGLGGAVLIERGDPVRLANVLSNDVIPADLSRGAAVLRGVSDSVASPLAAGSLVFALLLLPDGRLPSERRWRWFIGGAIAGIVVMFVAGLWAFRPWNAAAVTDDPADGIASMTGIVITVMALIGFVIRFRRSAGTARDQFKWVFWGAAMFVPATVVSGFTDGTDFEPLGVVARAVGGIAFVVGFGVAIGRYRLFDVDVVIRRTAIVAGLAAFITVVYAVLVGAAGLVVGFGTEATLPLSITATVVVAVAFQPLRVRMRRWVDRLVYGERASPYEVLSRLSARTREAVATEDVMPYLAELLATGTGAERAVVWLRHGDELHPAVVWPSGVEIAPVGHGGGDPHSPGAAHMAPVEHDGEVLGAVSVTMPGSEQMTAAAQRLVDDVASQAGLILRNARLIEELRSSRQRLVAAQDEERRRLERDLHDGRPAAVHRRQDEGRGRTAARHRGEIERVVDTLREILGDVDAGVESLRDLAHGIYPPLLEAEGLPAALRARVRKAPIPVTFDSAGLGRYPREVEAAVYFCVLEALQNAVKYSNAGAVAVTLRHEAGTLVFEVTDDGERVRPRHDGPGPGSHQHDRPSRRPRRHSDDPLGSRIWHHDLGSRTGRCDRVVLGKPKAPKPAPRPPRQPDPELISYIERRSKESDRGTGVASVCAGIDRRTSCAASVPGPRFVSHPPLMMRPRTTAL